MTKIEWTDETWNPIRGCSRVSEGCRNCYAEAIAGRFSGVGMPYDGLTTVGLPGKKSTKKWNGQIKFVEEYLLDPLKWKKPRRIFVNSMSDLFHENVTDEMRDRIFAVMALCPQHTFQVLTKRPERMLAYLTNEEVQSRWCMAGNPFEVESAIPLEKYADRAIFRDDEGVSRSVFSRWPLPNVWLGVSVENQKAADERIPLLLQTPAAVGFISAEPLLGAVSLEELPSASGIGRYLDALNNGGVDSGALIPGRLDWVIVGGESGPGARPMHPDWARSLRDQCEAAGVPFFFKQWGEWGWEPPIRWSATPDMAGQLYGPFRPTCGGPGSDKRLMCRAYPAKIPADLGGIGDSFWVMLEEAHRVGKKAAGHLLDGKEYHQFPAVTR